MVPGTTRVTELCCFLGFCFSLFLMEYAGCFKNFVQMTAEPGKAVAVISAQHTAIIAILLLSLETLAVLLTLKQSIQVYHVELVLYRN